MIEHPVPQNITEYQFHLIGNMTIKQFIILLVGVVLAFMFYSTNLPGIIKWPFMLVIVGGSGALAFVPYEERTLDQWLVNFIRAIYRPTKYYWQRTAPTPGYFTHEVTQSQALSTGQERSTLPQRQKQFSAYMSSLQTQSQGPVSQDPLDLFQGATGDLSSLFDSVEAAENVVPGETMAMEKPNLQVRARPLGSGQNMVFDTKIDTTPGDDLATPTSTPAAATAQWGNSYGGNDTYSTFTIDSVQESKHSQQEDATPSAPRGQAATTDVQTISVPRSAPTKTEVTQPETSAAQSATKTDNEPTGNAYVTESSVQRAPQHAAAPIPVPFNKDLPFPSLPDKPNLLLGMVHDQQKNIIPGAIVEILDENGNTVRAMKTNNLGQFYISTPLQTGKYTIEPKTNGHEFPVFALEVDGSVLDPVDILAQT
ncbi:PrgI family protein [Candidatus Woesebacteria bacterium]|nr:PrgI family protein [Candidatus Woesebacteria bacterium]